MKKHSHVLHQPFSWARQNNRSPVSLSLSYWKKKFTFTEKVIERKKSDIDTWILLFLLLCSSQHLALAHWQKEANITEYMWLVKFNANELEEVFLDGKSKVIKQKKTQSNRNIENHVNRRPLFCRPRWRRQSCWFLREKSRWMEKNYGGKIASVFNFQLIYF